MISLVLESVPDGDASGGAPLLGIADWAVPRLSPHFPDEPFDKEAGLLRRGNCPPDSFLSRLTLNARHNAPKHALFIQPDWLNVAQQGVSPNRYAYSHG